MEETPKIKRRRRKVKNIGIGIIAAYVGLYIANPVLAFFKAYIPDKIYILLTSIISAIKHFVI